MTVCRVDSTMEAKPLPTIGHWPAYVGIRLLEPGRATDDFLCHPDNERARQVIEKTLCQVRQVIDPEELLRRTRVEAVRPGHFSVPAKLILYLIQRLLQHIDLVLRQHLFDNDVPVDLDVQSLSGRQRGKRLCFRFCGH